MTDKRFEELMMHFDSTFGASYSLQRQTLLNTLGQIKGIFSEKYSSLREKGNNEIVTEHDLRVEEALKNAIQCQFPSHSFWGEETGIIGNHAYQWIIDPIDGTLNFSRGLPHFAISVALAHHGNIMMGAIYLPATDELFFAQIDCGSWLWKQRINVSEVKTLPQSVIDIGIYHGINGALQAVGIAANLLHSVRSIRSLGSTCVGLAYTACGRIDGFFHTASWPWDWAAGTLLVKEAGGKVTNDKNQIPELINDSQFIIGSNNELHHALSEIVRNSK